MKFNYNGFQGRDVIVVRSNSAHVAIASILMVMAFGLLIAAVVSYQNTVKFLQSSTAVQGQVLSVESIRGTDSQGRPETKWKSKVSFETSGGNKVKDFSKQLVEGQNVEGLFDRGTGELRLASEGYTSAHFFLGFGVVLLLISAFVGISSLLRMIEIRKLQANGQVIEARVIGVNEASHTSRHQGRSRTSRSYYVIAEYLCPTTGQKFKLKSEALDRNPGDELIGNSVKALIDPGNPAVHYLEV